MFKRISMPVDERNCLDCKVILTTRFVVHNNVLITLTLCGRQNISVLRRLPMNKYPLPPGWAPTSRWRGAGRKRWSRRRSSQEGPQVDQPALICRVSFSFPTTPSGSPTKYRKTESRRTERCQLNVDRLNVSGLNVDRRNVDGLNMVGLKSKTPTLKNTHFWQTERRKGRTAKRQQEKFIYYKVYTYIKNYNNEKIETCFVLL